MRLRTESLFGSCAITDAVIALATAGIEQRGAIFTRREVVDFILDLTGYTTDRPLQKLRLLEPSFGDGDFLIPAIDRLLEVWAKAGRPDAFRVLGDAIRAVELHRATFENTRRKVITRLVDACIAANDAEALADQWLIYGDFLLISLDEHFDVVIGNPPYVRQELIADVLMEEYRARYATIYDRADIYIPFIERGLDSLNKSGQLGFICADRWMKNRYGGPLRAKVARDFHLKVYVDMVDTPAFHSDVIAYPAITIITREKPGATRIAHRPEIEGTALSALATTLMASSKPDDASGVKEMQGVAIGSAPWILESSDQLALVRRLEKTFTTIEEAGCKVGIGVATGADQAYIGPFDELDVEDDRKLPLIMTRDILDGVVLARLRRRRLSRMLNMAQVGRILPRHITCAAVTARRMRAGHGMPARSATVPATALPCATPSASMPACPNPELISALPQSFENGRQSTSSALALLSARVPI